jgi:GH43 family beta-xylosidase
VFCALLRAQNQQLADSQTFTNPLLDSGPDPWVIYHDGFYYYTNTTARNLTLWKTRDITDLRDAEKKVVWTPPPSGPYSKQIWAPELHLINGVWYLYFAADNGQDANHRIWVLENSSPDPMQGNWTFKGELKPDEGWAIDPTVFENKGKWFIVWSGHDENGSQALFIGQLKNPWTIKGHSTEISRPEYTWEKDYEPDVGKPYPGVNEGPEALKHNHTIFLIFSASGCWTDQYALGMLKASEDSNLLKAKSWKKYARPVLSESPAAQAYGPGHNTFFKSPDGKQDWILYHANPGPHEDCRDLRSPRAQPFTWRPDGSPEFGTPVPLGQPIPKPSGTEASH